MSIKHNLLKNGIAASIQKLVRIAEQLLLVPFFISAWGAAYYGEWLTLTIIPSMLAFSDLGFGSAAASLFVIKYASGDKQGAANTIKTGLYVITGMIIFSVTISILGIFVLNYFHVFDKSLIDKYDAIWSVSILMASKILNFFQQLFEAQFRSARKAALSTNLLSVYSALNLIFGLLILLNGGNIVAFACVSLGISVFFNPVYGYVATRVLKLSTSYVGQIDKGQLKEITRKGFGYLLSPVWQAVFFQGTTFIVRITLGPTAVAVFNTVRTVSRTANQAFSLVISTVFPEFQFEFCSGNLKKARKIFNAALILNIVIAFLGITVLFLWGPAMYSTWTKNALIPSLSMWNVFLIGIAFNSIWWTAIIIFQAANRPYDYTLAGVISAFVSVIVSYFLCKYQGITGAAIGSVTLDILLAVYVLPKGIILLNTTIKNLIAESVRSLQWIYFKFYRKVF